MPPDLSSLRIGRIVSRICSRSSIATLNVYYPFHKLNSERQLRKLLDISPVQDQLNLRENSKWPKYLLFDVSEQFATESCANLPLLQVVERSCLRFKRDLCSCAHFLPA